MKERIEFIRTILYQINKHAENTPELYQRYHDPEYQMRHSLSARKFVERLEEFRRANLDPLKREVRELLSQNLSNSITSRLEIISEFLQEMEAEYSKGLMNNTTAYIVSKEHIWDKTRGIENNLKSIEEILKTYIE